MFAKPDLVVFGIRRSGATVSGLGVSTFARFTLTHNQPAQFTVLDDVEDVPILRHLYALYPAG